jgi:hypothetical protein
LIWYLARGWVSLGLGFESVYWLEGSRINHREKHRIKNQRGGAKGEIQPEGGREGGDATRGGREGEMQPEGGARVERQPEREEERQPEKEEERQPEREGESGR